jgi:hypothetical protein
MTKLIIKITLYQNVDPDLHDSVSHLPLRQRSAVIRRLWRQGLQFKSEERGMVRCPADLAGTHMMAAERTEVTNDHGSGGADDRLLREHLGRQNISGLSAFV